MPTKIEWCEETWNPITGCTPISEGCQNCYAKRMSKRLAGRCGYPEDEPFRVTLHPDKLDEPLKWKKTRRIFVCSMGDLFHPDVKDEWLDAIFAMMAKASQHTFLILTKRPERMSNYIIKAMYDENCNYQGWYEAIEKLGIPDATPMENIWLGVTTENQQRADERIPILLQIPAAVRFVSVEPMLGPVDLLSDDYLGGCINCEVYLDNPKTCNNCAQNRKLDWVICGGETGPSARPMHPEWARSLRDQCQAAGTPFFFKQWGKYISISQMPEDTYRAWDIHHGTEVGWEHDKPVWKVGKKFAGRLLDGREHNEYPEVTHERET